jgi:hypothetical protein
VCYSLAVNSDDNLSVGEKSTMSTDRGLSEKILNVLRPYASNWSGSLGRGDLVVPHREIPRLIRDLLDALQEGSERGGEASELEVFRLLHECRHLPSLQEQAQRLRQAFVILKRDG